MTKIKICGLYRPEDIQAVNAVQPDYAGFIVNFPKSHRNITPETLKALSAALSEEICPVGVFVDQPIEEIAQLQKQGVIQVAQLHGRETQADILKLKQLNGGKPVWKAFKIRSSEDLREAEGSAADMILLDNGTGTGQSFDWSLLSDVSRPYFLAGGIQIDNLDQAIRTLHPYGLDVSSGAETDRKKDPQKIREIVRKVRNV
jgi:phosphoribosylanthranilate isomerase